MTLTQGLQAALGGTHRIDRELGGGGMSRLFVATEIGLDRSVVIKVLPPELTAELSVERFRREVLLAAKLQHPLIVPVLTTGECDGLPYFIMPLVDGESLRDRLTRTGELTIAEVLRIGRDVASALAYAHESGVVHRDIKPENILLVREHALVTDFGVAKAIESSVTSSGERITHVGTVLGTPAYMSPEQASADPTADHRADLYSLGVMLYEMLCATTPFAGRSAQGMLAAHASLPPEPVERRRATVPKSLGRLVHRLLEKSPADRPQSATEVVAALDDIARPGHTAPRSTGRWRLSRRTTFLGAAAVVVAATGAVSWTAFRRGPDSESRVTAVLPFENVNGDTANRAFAEGIADELIIALGHLPGLQVTGRNSSFSTKLRDASASEIGRALKVGSYVHGTVRRSGSRVRVTAQLVSTRSGLVLWSDDYERPLTDIFQVQDDIARAIASELRVTLSKSTTVTANDVSRGTSDVEAYRLYLDGKQRWAMRGTANLLASIDLFTRAAARDSMFARARAGLALALVVLPGNDTQFEAVQDTIIAAGVAHAKAALALAPNDPDARCALAFAKAFQWKWDEAEADFLSVIKWDPSNTTARIWYGLQLTAQGRTEEAIEQLQRAVELDPLSQVAARNLAAAQMMGHRFEDAYATDKRMLPIDSSASRANVAMLQAAMFAERYDEAHHYAKRLAEIGAVGLSHLEDALVYARAGDENRAREELAIARVSSGVGRADMAFAFGLLGEADSVMSILETTADLQGHGFVDNMQVCLPYFESVWPDPRFAKLTRRMGIAMCSRTGVPRRTTPGL